MEHNHVTMGIRTMPWSEWIELDSEFAEYQRTQDSRLQRVEVVCCGLFHRGPLRPHIWKRTTGRVAAQCVSVASDIELEADSIF